MEIIRATHIWHLKCPPRPSTVRTFCADNSFFADFDLIKSFVSNKIYKSDKFLKLWGETENKFVVVHNITLLT